MHKPHPYPALQLSLHSPCAQMTINMRHGHVTKRNAVSSALRSQTTRTLFRTPRSTGLITVGRLGLLATPTSAITKAGKEDGGHHELKKTPDRIMML
jgi:hypothetical protein